MRAGSWGLAIALGAACADPPPGRKAEPDSRVYLSDRDWLVRASLAIRGIRPSVADMELLEADPDQAGPLVDGYLRSPEFLETVKDLHADLLLLRTDGVPQYPALGPLLGKNLRQMYEGFTNEPLELVAHIVDGDRPYTDLVTADTTYVNEVGALLWGLSYDPSVGGVQETRWSDGRPLAGVLSSSKLLLRYESAGSNFHRARANVIADKLLCAPFATRDIVVESGIDITDTEAVAASVMQVPECVACHQGLDPLAAFVWGFKEILRQNQVGHAYENGCDDDFHDVTLPDLGPSHRTSHYCYPLVLYGASEVDRWATYGLRPPAYFGAPAEDLAQMGELAAADPRFSRCAVKNFASYLTATSRDDVGEDAATELQASFEESGYSVRALVRAVVLSDDFRAAGVEDGTADDPFARLRVIRPEQYARSLEDLTGFVWNAVGDPPDCATLSDRGMFGTQCWGAVDLGRSDRFGYHAMSGGTDSFWIVNPTHAPSPIQVLARERFAWNAAGYVVDEDFAKGAPDRKLLGLVEPDTHDEATVRAQLAALRYRILADETPDDDPAVDEVYALFETARAARDAPSAWKLVIAALLQDPGMTFL